MVIVSFITLHTCACMCMFLLCSLSLRSHPYAPYYNECDQGYSVVTGSPKTSGCGHRVIERFLVWSQGHEHFSALLHGVTEQCCAEQSQRTLHIHPMVPQVHAYIMAYGSTPYVGMTPKKNGGHIKSAQMTRSKCLH